MDNMDYKEEFVHFMAASGVLTFGDFITKSGRKTPYFINTGSYKTGAQMARLGVFYAKCITEKIGHDFTALFGPAYKGIPLSIATAIGLHSQYGIEVNYCFNRKEEKDHGEGGSLVGYPLKDGDDVVIVEDVITAGTAIRQTLPVLKAAADINVKGLIISVDRMEKGLSEKTAAKEIEDEFGIKTYSIVTVLEVIDILHNKKVGGKIYIDDDMKEKMEGYFNLYCKQ